MKTRVRVHEYPDGTLAVFLGPHRLADYTAEGVLVSPDTLEPGRVLGAVKDEPLAGRAKCASLTAPARAAPVEERVGAEKRASSRTKKPPRTPAPAAAAVA